MFNIIAVSETWVDKDQECDMELEGYEMFTINRLDRKGGGAALLL